MALWYKSHTGPHGSSKSQDPSTALPTCLIGLCWKMEKQQLSIDIIYHVCAMLHWLSVKCTSWGWVRSCEFSQSERKITTSDRPEWCKFDANLIDNQWSTHNKLSLYHTLYGNVSKCSSSWCFLLQNDVYKIIFIWFSFASSVYQYH